MEAKWAKWPDRSLSQRDRNRTDVVRRTIADGDAQLLGAGLQSPFSGQKEAVLKCVLISRFGEAEVDRFLLHAQNSTASGYVQNGTRILSRNSEERSCGARGGAPSLFPVLQRAH